MGATGNMRVLYIRMNGGEVESIEDQNRAYYERKDGTKFIKTVSDGQVEIDHEDRAILAYRKVRSASNRMWLWQKYTPSEDELRDAIEDMLASYGLAHHPSI